jgi:hypothetical protein
VGNSTTRDLPDSVRLGSSCGVALSGGVRWTTADSSRETGQRQVDWSRGRLDSFVVRLGGGPTRPSPAAHMIPSVNPRARDGHTEGGTELCTAAILLGSSCTNLVTAAALIVRQQSTLASSQKANQRETTRKARECATIPRLFFPAWDKVGFLDLG